jgi:hypothetical protein
MLTDYDPWSTRWRWGAAGRGPDRPAACRHYDNPKGAHLLVRLHARDACWPARPSTTLPPGLHCGGRLGACHAMQARHGPAHARACKWLPVDGSVFRSGTFFALCCAAGAPARRSRRLGGATQADVARCIARCTADADLQRAVSTASAVHVRLDVSLQMHTTRVVSRTATA